MLYIIQQTFLNNVQQPQRGDRCIEVHKNKNTEEHAKNIRNLFQSFLNDLKMFTESLVYED